MANGRDPNSLGNIIDEDWKDKLIRKLDDIISAISQTDDEIKELRIAVEQKLGIQASSQSNVGQVQIRVQRMFSDDCCNRIVSAIRELIRTIRYTQGIFVGIRSYVSRILDFVQQQRSGRQQQTQQDQQGQQQRQTRGRDRDSEKIGVEDNLRVIREYIGQIVNAIMGIRRRRVEEERPKTEAEELIEEWMEMARRMVLGPPEEEPRIATAQFVRALGGIITSVTRSFRNFVRDVASRFGTGFGILKNVSDALEKIIDIIRLPLELVVMGLLMPFLVIMLRTVVPILEPVLRALANFVRWIMNEGGLAGIFSGALAGIGMLLVSSLMGAFSPLFGIVAIFLTLAVAVQSVIEIYNRLRQVLGTIPGIILTVITVITSLIVSMRMYSVTVTAVSTVMNMLGIAATSATFSLIGLAVAVGMFGAIIFGVLSLINWISNRRPTNVIEYQSGGYVPATGWYYLHAGEYVVPAHRVSERGGAGNVFNINVNVEANVSSDIDIDKLGSEIADRIMREVRMRISGV